MPNKGLERLAESLVGERCIVHIIGRLTAGQRLLLHRCCIEYENQANITDLEMHKAYVDADVVTFISVAEGFGLPIIEANAIGRPVITSRMSPMCDVAGHAACLVDPMNIEDIRRGVRRVLHDAGYREELITNGYENVTRFAAREVADRYAELYREVIAHNHPTLRRDGPLQSFEDHSDRPCGPSISSGLRLSGLGSDPMKGAGDLQ
jgi:glycosyltransferase involved in cell wall biosynthesis